MLRSKSKLSGSPAFKRSVSAGPRLKRAASAGPLRKQSSLLGPSTLKRSVSLGPSTLKRSSSFGRSGGLKPTTRPSALKRSVSFEGTGFNPITPPGTLKRSSSFGGVGFKNKIPKKSFFRFGSKPPQAPGAVAKKIPIPPPPPKKGGFFGIKPQQLPVTAPTNLTGPKMLVPTPNESQSQLLTELRERTQMTRNMLNRNAKQSEGGNFTSGVQRVERNQTKIQALGAQNRMIEELKQRFARGSNKTILETIGRLAPGLRPVPYKRGIRNFDRTKQILVNAKGRPYIVFIPAQMRDQNREILSDERLRPSLLNMRFLRQSQDPQTAVFGNGYYNTRFFGLTSAGPVLPGVPGFPLVPDRCIALRERLSGVMTELERYKCNY